jgi:2-keto-4-pentenoate hydratase
MSASVYRLEEIASHLHQAARTQKPIAQISTQQELTIDQAYEVQELLLQHRYNEGEKLIGLKMGFTSEAKMQQMGVNDLIWGRLTDAMLIENAGKAQRSSYIHPRVEPEICFRISKDIPGELNEHEVINYVDAVCTAIEVIDSRYENFKFSLADVIADNCSSTGFVLGPWQPVPESLNNLPMSLSINQELVASGNSNDIMNNPWRSLAAATRLATQYGQPITAGMIILAGAATNAEFLQLDQEATATVETLGSVGFRF